MVADRLCVYDRAVPTVEFDDGNAYAKIVRKWEKSDDNHETHRMAWLINALQVSFKQWELFMRRTDIVLDDIKQAIVANTGKHDRYNAKLDLKGVATQHLRVTVRGYELDVGINKWPLFVRATPENLTWLVKELLRDLHTTTSSIPSSTTNLEQTDGDETEVPPAKSSKLNHSASDEAAMLQSAIEERGLGICR